MNNDSEYVKISIMVKAGFKSAHGEPLKCNTCGSKDMVDTDGYEDGHIVHKVRYCGNCKHTLGEWDYGSWSW